MHLGAAAHLLLGDQPPAVPGLYGVGLLGASAPGAGRGGLGLVLGLIAGGQGVPLLCGNVRLIEVQVSAPSSQASVAGVLMDGRRCPWAKAASLNPGVGLVAIDDLIIGILGHPQGTGGGDGAPVVRLDDAAGHIQHTPHTGELVHPLHELLDVGFPGHAIGFVVDDGNSLAKVVFGVGHKKFRLFDGVSARKEVIEPPPLAKPDALLHPGVAGVLHQLGSFSCLDDGKVKVDIAQVQPPLIGTDVNASHAHFTFPPYFSARQWRW